jgi:amidase
MSAADELTSLSASEAAAMIRSGRLTSTALVEAYIDRIAARDDVVHAWVWFDPEAALAQARAADASAATGALHGVPVGLKDVIDTADMPTEYGAEAFAGHRPDKDARSVELLRAAGAIIMGKLVTAEFATYQPGPTANPINPAHTPGGSSSGSAAAVADRQVPLSLGTQTAGSVIRPGSFCGIHGFKPTIGRYPTAGVLDTAHRLDTLGVFARFVDDLLLIDAVLAPQAPASDPLPAKPRIGIYRSAVWDEASPAMQAALEQTARRLADLGHEVFDVPVIAPFDRIGDAQSLIHMHEAFLCMGHIRREHASKVSQKFKDFIDDGERVSAADYAQACTVQDACKAAEGDLFAGADLLLSPGAPGIAPEGLDATGNPTFNRMSTALGVPCLGFPGGEERGLPLGLQLMGRTGTDRSLLQAGATIVAALA